MATVQNSTYFPLPLANGQILMGKSTFPPVVNNLTAGANISISNGPGFITIAAQGITWQTPGSTSVTMVPFIGYNTGTSASNYTFTLPGTMSANDMFAVSGSFSTFTINRASPNQKIYWDGTNGNTITMPNPGSSITVFCSDFIGSIAYLTIMNSSGTFTLT